MASIPPDGIQRGAEQNPLVNRLKCWAYKATTCTALLGALKEGDYQIKINEKAIDFSDAILTACGMQGGMEVNSDCRKKIIDKITDGLMEAGIEKGKAGILANKILNENILADYGSSENGKGDNNIGDINISVKP